MRARQPAPRLNRDAILAAAVRIVDAEGLAALSMRRLAREVGVEAMSLYHHFPSKEALLDGLHGALLAELPPPPRRGAWRSRLAASVRGFRAVLASHPHALPLFATRPAAAPTSLAHFEAVLGLLEEAGFDAAGQVRAVHSLMSYVIGSCLWQTRDDQPVAGVDYDALPAEEFPRLSRLGPLLVGWDREAEFTLGLEALLDGLAARARRRGKRRT